MANSVYDPEKSDDTALGPDRSGPGALDNPTAAGRTSHNRKGLRGSEENAGSLYNPSGDTAGQADNGAASGTGNAGSESPEDLRDAEENADEGFASGFGGAQRRSRRRRVRNFVSRNR